METELSDSLLGTEGIAVLLVYMLVLIGLGLYGKSKQRSSTAGDFYLGGKSLGFVVLLLTLYATQYSGNTLIGFAGKAYREGFVIVSSMTSMMSVVVMYFVFAPKLRKLADKHGFVTLGDFLQQRFESRTLVVLAGVSCIVALANYILSNLKAMGYIVEVVTNGAVSFEAGIVGAAIVMVVYESLGGMRSVAWTDAIQGVILLIGCVTIVALIFGYIGSPQEIFTTLRAAKPEFWDAPTGTALTGWLSSMLLFMFGISLYPHAIQRIYAAESVATLRRAFKVMLFMPIVTTLFMVFVASSGHVTFPGLDAAGSELVSLKTLEYLASHSIFAHVVLISFICAAIAAIMSTVDSALLSISSIFTQDLRRQNTKTASTLQILTHSDKFLSWILMALLVVLAISVDQTIWRLMIIKLELLVQLMPVVLLGLFWKRANTQAIISGFVVGTGIAILGVFGQDIGLAFPSRIVGFHTGIVAMFVNALLCVIGSILLSTSDKNTTK